MRKDIHFHTYATQGEADAAVRTYNTFVADGKGRVAFWVRTAPCTYEVWFHQLQDFWCALRAAA